VRFCETQNEICYVRRFAMAKKRAPVYDPSKKPKDYLPAHNHILHTPKFTNGMNGFRCFWIPPEWVGKGWSKCPCGWADRIRPEEWKVHYARADSVKYWHEEIAAHGSLKAFHREIVRRLKDEARA
jgi:hypothetical protein